MFGLSFTHLVLLAIIALIFIGPEQLPEVARTIARLLNEWKRASSDIQSSLSRTFHDDVYRPSSPPDPPPPPAADEPVPIADQTPTEATSTVPPTEDEKKS